MRDLIIACEHQRQEIIEHQSKIIREVKYLPDKFITPVGIEILADRIFMEIYAEPATLIEIRSQAVALGYKNYFEVLWRVGKR